MLKGLLALWSSYARKNMSQLTQQKVDNLAEKGPDGLSARSVRAHLVVMQLDIGLFGRLDLASPPEECSTHAKGCFLCRLLPLQLSHHLVQLVPPLVAAHDGHGLIKLSSLHIAHQVCATHCV